MAITLIGRQRLGEDLAAVGVDRHGLELGVGSGHDRLSCSAVPLLVVERHFGELAPLGSQGRVARLLATTSRAAISPAGERIRVLQSIGFSFGEGPFACRHRMGSKNADRFSKNLHFRKNTSFPDRRDFGNCPHRVGTDHEQEQMDSAGTKMSPIGTTSLRNAAPILLLVARSARGLIAM